VKRIESLLSREIGLNPSSIGKSAIDAAVKVRSRAVGVSKVSDYWVKLEHSQAERRALVEEIVVSETWFFRDEDVFKTLAKHATAWLRRESSLRVLSLPCATGEEPYSVAIALLQAGIGPTRFQVRGVDVSERALAKARRGVYGKNAFRGATPEQHPGYFEPVEGGTAVTELVRGAVTFSSGNVLDALSFSSRSFDVILCRNLLIYLDPQARAKALTNLSHWLADAGVLFAGHAEALELMDSRFHRLSDAAPFAYVKQALLPPTEPIVKRAPAALRARPTSSRVRTPAPKPPLVKSTSAASLPQATQLADAGKLQEARAVCERVLGESGASSEAYRLLGIIHQASGDIAAAIDCFNKALYLEPTCYEALVHLALLHERRGELPAAENFRRRAERARKADAK
jgi:chemotaxis protein methyltransferase WspC